MKANKIEKNNVYEVKVGKNTTQVRVLKMEDRGNGAIAFVCKNIKTGNPMTITDAGRFIKAVTVKAARVREDGTLSVSNAAYKVLTETRQAMTMREIYEAVSGRGYCVLNGQTPMLTVYGVIANDLRKNGNASRFRKAGRGKFATR